MGKKVLIVEDEVAIVEILKFNLQREGYETLEALDGETGLQLARSADPDLMLLDVMLPKMTGFDVCAALRQEGKTVPILMLTAREEEADKVFGLEVGADDRFLEGDLPKLEADSQHLLLRACKAGRPDYTDGVVQIGGKGYIPEK